MRIGGGHFLTMGDLVVLDAELQTVIDALQKGGIEQSALHNHVSGESPHVMYIHFMAPGDPSKLGRTLRDALSLTKTPMEPPPASSPPIELPAADLDRIIGHPGKVAAGRYQFTIARGEKVGEHGVGIPHFWANDDAKKLATTLRRALDRVNTKKCAGLPLAGGVHSIRRNHSTSAQRPAPAVAVVEEKP